MAADAPNRASSLTVLPEGSAFLVCGNSSLPVVGVARVSTVPLVNAARTCLQQVIGPGRSPTIRRVRTHARAAGTRVVRNRRVSRGAIGSP